MGKFCHIRKKDADPPDYICRPVSLKKGRKSRISFADDPEPTAEASFKLTGKDMRAIRRLALDFERAIDFYYLRQRPGRHIILGLVNGMARGVGFAIGVSVLAFVLVQILQALNVLELPIIGDFIARLLDYVEEARRIGIEKY